MRSPPLGFQSDQRAAIEAFMSGCDVFVGSGKSFCYWILPKLFDRRAGGSVVSSLLVHCALMKDQIEALTRRDATAVYAGANADAILLDRADISNSSYQHCR